MRKTLNIPDNIHDWFENRAKELNISTSAMMIIALNEYVKQEGALKTLDGVLTAMKSDKK
ncbi:MAG: hypothetical protein GX277_02295 [Bacteroidales bacterium]|nr:hypothetical protein [Bacteroidales bacterium]